MSNFRNIPDSRKYSIMKEIVKYVSVCFFTMVFSSFSYSGNRITETDKGQGIQKGENKQSTQVLTGIKGYEGEGQKMLEGNELNQITTTKKTPADYVNPFIDTHSSRAIHFSSACRPFGMVNLSPDTRIKGGERFGYTYDSLHVRCFSHIHGWVLSGVAVMPTVGDMNGHLGMDVYKSSFRHEEEIAKPGYHKVFLEDYGIKAELTSTDRVGFHRYTFPKSEKSHIIFATGEFFSQAPKPFSKVWKVNDYEIAGYEIMGTTRYRSETNVPVYFVARLNKPIDEFICWKDGQLLNKKLNGIEGVDVGAAVSFSTSKGEEVLMKVAISYVSIEQARLNLEAELVHWDFDNITQDSYDEWNNWLGKIKIEGGTEKQRVKFYTDLWHVLLGRRKINDVNGKYPDNTGNIPIVRQSRLGKDGKPVYPHYNFDSLWGTHWNLGILWSIAYPEVMDGFCNTMVDIYQNGGMIPRCPSGGNYTYVMIGDPAASFFAAAYNKKIRDYDVGKAYEGLRKNAFPGGIRDYAHSDPNDSTFGGMSYYVQRGYVPIRQRGFNSSASMTLEYAYQDWCLAQMAKNMGKEKDYQLFIKRSQNYKKLWNPENEYMHPRDVNGDWSKNFTPVGKSIEQIQSWDWGICEGNSAVYSYYVPHDIAGLITLFGGKEKFTSRLNDQFVKGKTFEFNYQPYHSGWVDYSNQPGAAMAHLFNYAGKPWLTQKWVREVKESFCDTTAYGGYKGDEDQGQMGALGVLMAIGLFEVDGGANVNPYYEITSPVFDEIEISLNPDYYKGRTFRIVTKNNSKENKYIQSAKLNGKRWNKCWFPHETLLNGGTLELELGAEPNKKWGIEPPPSSF
ncbi:MAG: GH92 family glycosyl hydrolase [Bacteroidota bacterium]